MTEQQQHLGLDALADLLAGEGSEADVAHVGRCAGCAARLAELDEAQLPVATALAALPAPPLPDGLAARLSAALEAAGPLPASEPLDGPLRPTAVPPPDEDEEFDRAASGQPASRTVTPLQGSRRRPDGRSRRTWLPAAAVAVLALTAGGLALTALAGGDDSETASTAGGGAGDVTAAQPESAAEEVVVNESGRDYAAGPQVFDELLPDVLAGRARAADEPAGEQERDLSADSGLATAGGGDLERLRDPAALEACLSALVPEDGSVQPLAVDYAAYAGQPALVVVLPTQDPASLDVFVVGAGCAPGNDSTLFFTRVDRP